MLQHIMNNIIAEYHVNFNNYFGLFTERYYKNLEN